MTCPPSPSVDNPSGNRLDRLLRLNQVKEIVGLGRTMIYQLIAQGSFPRPIKLGANASRWSEQHLCAWLDEQKALSLQS